MNSELRAPDFPAGFGWLNTDKPLRFEHELHGQVVVLDFWTYCCINCMHILPDLAYLEDKYHHDPVAFIGVHSAKFRNEASRETIRSAILRYEIKHPVIIDENMTIWRNYGVRSWPTLVVIDAAGHVIGVVSGEGQRNVIDSAIAQALQQGNAQGTLAKEPLELQRDGLVRATSGLAFPGKVLADKDSRRLFVADSNHNRVIIAQMPDEAGFARVIQVMGSGWVGTNDGQPDRATFHHPQGLALRGNTLYVADTENHLIRAIDLESFQVSTLVGTGRMENDRSGGLMGTQQGLNSPWDLVIEGSTMYVAMAGLHQIWRIDLPVGLARALAGSGRENIVDGPTETAALAQPSGICILNGKIYFADSEASAIRGIDLATEQVFTVMGEGLFSFGDADGTAPTAKLQHPLGVAAYQQSLLIADTYNHKIKRIDPASRSSTSLYGRGAPGVQTDDGAVAFFEPGGLSVTGDQLFVADTNNHRIVHIDLTTNRWREVILDGLVQPNRRSTAHEASNSTPIKVDTVTVNPGQDAEILITIQCPKGTHLSSDAPWSVRVTAMGRAITQQTGKSNIFPLSVKIPAKHVITDVTWQANVAFAYCANSKAGCCIPAEIAWKIPVQKGQSNSPIKLRANISI